MTIQVLNRKHGTSKAALTAALKADPSSVLFLDPSIFPGSRGSFTANDMTNGESFPVVMDHPRCLRFAEVARKPNGSYHVS